MTKAIASFVGRNVDSVLVDAIDLGERLYQINSVTFVAPEPGSDRMSIDSDPHVASKSSAAKRHKSAKTEENFCAFCAF